MSYVVYTHSPTPCAARHLIIFRVVYRYAYHRDISTIAPNARASQLPSAGEEGALEAPSEAETKRILVSSLLEIRPKIAQQKVHLTNRLA